MSTVNVRKVPEVETGLFQHFTPQGGFTLRADLLQSAARSGLPA
ncbi:hypothetical protein [Adhaeribacter terreus]|uniref:Uncharacterized protein n=1 Tax=Adhaeribacter terreus TaxID=529703 RepID=A0ABW0ED56_9BACT